MGKTIKEIINDKYSDEVIHDSSYTELRTSIARTVMEFLPHKSAFDKRLVDLLKTIKHLPNFSTYYGTVLLEEVNKILSEIEE